MKNTVTRCLTAKQAAQLYRIAADTQQGTGLDELAFVTLMRICRDYVNPNLYTAIPDEDRDKWFADRLKKFRIRFFEKI
ncbi:hypothetical protein [uncultured Alistipes sp.]|uniref:hypothetical protein n=1 Tax=uncultured Alistipes sp. TaxID=538949 RepID=UPI00266CB484|nr:hypothetical protein [uncultured Alistipes sp.]